MPRGLGGAKEEFDSFLITPVGADALSLYNASHRSNGDDDNPGLQSTTMRNTQQQSGSANNTVSLT
jgi:hypothetical protein